MFHLKSFRIESGTISFREGKFSAQLRFSYTIFNGYKSFEEFGTIDISRDDILISTHWFFSNSDFNGLDVLQANVLNSRDYERIYRLLVALCEGEELNTSDIYECWITKLDQSMTHLVFTLPNCQDFNFVLSYLERNFVDLNCYITPLYGIKLDIQNSTLYRNITQHYLTKSKERLRLLTN